MRWAVRLTKPVLMVVAFALSMSLYLYVQSQTSPMDSREVQLVVHSNGSLSNQLIFDQEGVTVPYQITGQRDKIDRFMGQLKDNPDYVIAAANLSSVTLGRDEKSRYIDSVPLKPTKKPDTEGLEFIQLRRLSGKIEKPLSQLVKIEVSFVNPPTPGAWSDYDPASFECTPDMVTLTGGAADVKDKKLSVVINPEEVERDQVYDAPLTIPQNVDCKPFVTKVTVRPSHHTRQAYVNVIFNGHLAPGFSISNFYVVGKSGQMSSTTAIRGPAGVVDKIATIDATVDISGLKGNFTFKPKLTIPRQVELLDSPLKIRVDVQKTRQ